MALDTFTNLKASISAWLKRPEFGPGGTSEGLTEDFIRLTEDNVNRTLRTLQMEGRASVQTVAGQDKIALPDDWHGTRQLIVVRDPEIVLQYEPPNSINAVWAPFPGIPKAFTIEDGEIKLRPIPDSDGVQIDHLYWQKVPALGASTASNWLLAEFPDVYLYGGLVQAKRYLEYLPQDYQADLVTYTSALQEIQSEDQSKRRSQPAVMRPDFVTY